MCRDRIARARIYRIPGVWFRLSEQHSSTASRFADLMTSGASLATTRCGRNVRL